MIFGYFPTGWNNPKKKKKILWPSYTTTLYMKSINSDLETGSDVWQPDCKSVKNVGKSYGVFQPLVNSQKWVTVERLWNCKSISPGLHWSSQSSSSDPSLQSISPSHTWLYSTHSRPSLQGLVPTRHLKSAVAVVLVAMVEHPTSSEPSRQWERPSQTRASSIHFLLSLQRKSPVWIQHSILGMTTSWRRRKTRNKSNKKGGEERGG